MKKISEYTQSGFIRHLTSVNKYDAIEELARVFEGSDVCQDVDKLVIALKEREEIMSTGIGFNIAIPHAKIPEVKDISFAIGVSKKGIEFDSMDGNPVNLIILVAAGEKQHKDYLALLSNIMAFLKDTVVKEKIINSKTSDDIMKIFEDNTK
jgi:mannitol/fructose-specific phosphotransferase system IIA component (Ntr-type)